MASTAGLGDDTLELVDLSLGTTEGTELRGVSIVFISGGSENTYTLLGELTGALVARVAEQLNNTALVGGEAGFKVSRVHKPLWDPSTLARLTSQAQPAASIERPVK